MSLAKSTWNTIPGLKERKVWGCGLFGNGLVLLAWALGSILSTTKCEGGRATLESKHWGDQELTVSLGGV